MEVNFMPDTEKKLVVFSINNDVYINLFKSRGVVLAWEQLRATCSSRPFQVYDVLVDLLQPVVFC
jgi:hypothetical protein